jgi:L-alanine-DL-glutamate epimerase-like enolase superfamily enzyme
MNNMQMYCIALCHTCASGKKILLHINSLKEFPTKLLFLHMLQIKYKSISTAFHHPFTTAHGIKTHQPALLVAITFNGITGIGEAPAIHYYNVTVESMIDELLEKIHVLSRYSFTEPDRFWHFCHHLFPTNHFLVCALDMAYWNMYAQMKRKKITEIWNLEWTNIPMTDYTIGLDSAEVMAQKMNEKPWPIYKVKLAQRNDIEKLHQLRAQTDATIRIDANAAWSLDDAVTLLPILEELNIELIEQPLSKDNWEGMKELYKHSNIPLIADESCVVESDVARCANHFHGINIKLTKCSGLTPAKRMIEQARQLNLRVMMGCMNETEVGSVAIAYFLPLLDYVDMDGPLLLDTPPLTQLNYDYGVVSWK